MDTWIGFLVMAMVGGASLAFFYGVIQKSKTQPIDRISTEPYRVSDAVFIATVILFLSSLYVVSALLAAGKKPELTIDAIITGCFINLGLISGVLMFLAARGINPLRIFGLKGVAKPKDFLIGLGFLVAAYPLIILAQLVSTLFTTPEAQPQEVVTFLLNSHKWTEQLAVSVLAIVMAPMAEELIFRGYLFGVIRKYGGRRWAILVTSLIFAAIHVHLPAMAALFILAVVLCLAYERTGSLWVPIFMHACFNAVSVYIAVFHPSLAQP